MASTSPAYNDRMRLKVKLFAVARQRAGRACVEVELPAAATVGQLRASLIEQHPPLAPILAHVRFAVNSEYAADSLAIPAAAEVALIPPVSGG
jgi:molybdopterin converting factor subunit 1